MARPRDHVEDPITHKRIEGLSLHKKTGEFYLIDDKGKRVYLGKDFTLAKHRLDQWKLLHDPLRTGDDFTHGIPKTVQIVEPSSLEPGEKKKTEDYARQVKRIHKLSPWHWSLIRQHILTDLDGFCGRVGLRIKVIDAPDTSPTLDDVGKPYLDRKDLDAETVGKAKKWWQEFCEAVYPANRVGEVSKAKVLAYRDGIKANPKWGPKVIKHRFTTIGTILRTAQAEGFSCPELSQLLDHVRMLKPPKAGKKPKPKPISRENYDALLNAAKDDVRMTAILLIALNCGMYLREVCDIDLEDIDLDKGTLVAQRSKTSIVRVGCLWNRTKEAIRRYLSENPHDSGPLFVSVNGRLSHWTAREDFRNLRTVAEVSDDVLFEHIRDGSQTSAIAGGADPMHTKILLGHAVGIDDAYLLRNPRMVKDATDAIGRAYGIK